MARSGLPEAWIGAGAVRDAVWGARYGRFEPADVRDIDVAFFDRVSLGSDRDLAAQEALHKLADARGLASTAGQAAG